MTSWPYSVYNAAGLVFHIDTNIIDGDSAADALLRRLDTEGWLKLHRADPMDTELMTAGDDKRASLLEASSRYPEVFGPVVLGHSRLDSAVLAREEDAARQDQVFTILFPGADRATARANQIKDAMHVATAIR